MKTFKLFSFVAVLGLMLMTSCSSMETCSAYRSSNPYGSNRTKGYRHTTKRTHAMKPVGWKTQRNRQKQMAAQFGN